MIFTRSAGAMTVFATAPATPPATSDSTAVVCFASMYVAGVGAGGDVAHADAASRPAGTVAFNTSFAVKPMAAASGPFTHVKPTPLNSPFHTPSVR